MFISEEERKREREGGGDSGEIFPQNEREKSYLFFERPPSLGF